MGRKAKTPKPTSLSDTPLVIKTNIVQDRLVAAILDNQREFLISEKVEDMLDAYNLARNLYTKYVSRAKVIQRLVEDHGFAERTAWRIADNTPRLFSIAVREVATRSFWADILMSKIIETRTVAFEQNNPAAMAAADANFHKAIATFYGEVETPDPDLTKLPDVVQSFQPELFPDLPPVNSTEFQNIKAAFAKKKERRDKLQVLDIDFNEEFTP